MSIQSEIERLTQAKREIRQAIQDKGVEVPEGTPFRQYAEKIGEISAMTQEQADARYLQLAGGILTGSLYLSGDPSQDLQAATKGYVDSAGLKITTGSYVGTGVAGDGNQNSIIFEFNPKIVYISTLDGRAGSYDRDWAIFNCQGLSSSYKSYAYTVIQGAAIRDSNGNTYLKSARVSGNTLSWKSALDAAQQLNMSGRTYYYVAIGV